MDWDGVYCTAWLAKGVDLAYLWRKAVGYILPKVNECHDRWLHVEMVFIGDDGKKPLRLS